MSFKLNDKVKIKNSVTINDLLTIGFDKTGAENKMRMLLRVENISPNAKHKEYFGTKIHTNYGWYWDWMLELSDKPRYRGHPLTKIFKL